MYPILRYLLEGSTGTGQAELQITGEGHGRNLVTGAGAARPQLIGEGVGEALPKPEEPPIPVVWGFGGAYPAERKKTPAFRYARGEAQLGIEGRGRAVHGIAGGGRAQLELQAQADGAHGVAGEGSATFRLRARSTGIHEQIDFVLIDNELLFLAA